MVSRALSRRCFGSDGNRRGSDVTWRAAGRSSIHPPEHALLFHAPFRPIDVSAAGVTIPRVNPSRFIAISLGGATFLALLWASVMSVPGEKQRWRRGLFEPPPPAPSVTPEILRERTVGATTQWLTDLDDRAATLRVERRADSATLIQRGQTALRRGEAAAAFERFDMALARTPLDPAAMRGRAEALTRLGRHAGALDDYEALVRSGSATPRDRYNFAVGLTRAGRDSEALAELRTAIDAEPNFDEAVFNLAAGLQRLGRLTEAADAWQRLLARQPGLTSAWFNLGVVWADLERFEKAAECFERVLQTRPDDPLALINAGVAKRAMGRAAESVGYLERALRDLPDDPVAMNELIESHLELARQSPAGTAHREEALRWARRSLELNPDQPALRDLVAGDQAYSPRSSDARTTR